MDRFVRILVICFWSAGRRAASDVHFTGSPLNEMSPAWLSSNRLQHRSNVDLPDPEDPINEMTSPRLAVTSTPFKTFKFPEALCRFVICMTGLDKLTWFSVSWFDQILKHDISHYNNQKTNDIHEVSDETLGKFEQIARRTWGNDTQIIVFGNFNYLI